MTLLGSLGAFPDLHTRSNIQALNTGQIRRLMYAEFRLQQFASSDRSNLIDHKLSQI